ncbi:MAG: hypothetical protein AB7Q97_16265 [Gammaproteobacteria bacterium]
MQPPGDRPPALITTFAGVRSERGDVVAIACVDERGREVVLRLDLGVAIDLCDGLIDVIAPRNATASFWSATDLQEGDPILDAGEPDPA